MKKVLILGVAAVQYDSIKYLNENGFETYAIAMKADGPGAKEANHFDEINFVDESKVVDYINENDIDIIYSTGSDLAIPIANRISEKLNMPHFVDSESATICNNKDLMRNTLGKDFEGNIPFDILTEINDEITIDYPFIMKPTDSQGQRGINIIKSKEEFIEKFEETKGYSRSRQVIIERYVGGTEVSVNGYLLDGSLKFILVSDRVTWPEYTGLIHKHVIPSKALSDQGQKKLERILENASNKIGIKNGPVYAQVKVENDEPYIIEITSRLDGCHMWKLIKFATGFDLLKLTYDHLVNNDTNELEKVKDPNSNYTLEFICQKPNTNAVYNDEDIDGDTLDYYKYYNDGDLIKPVNGKFDKIGYTIYKNK